MKRGPYAAGVTAGYLALYAILMYLWALEFFEWEVGGTIAAVGMLLAVNIGLGYLIDHWAAVLLPLEILLFAIPEWNESLFDSNGSSIGYGAVFLAVVAALLLATGVGIHRLQRLIAKPQK